VPALPELGVGTIWLAGLDPWIEACEPLLDFLEIEPATMTLADGSRPAADDALRRLADDPRPIIAHSVSAPIGGTIAPDTGFEAVAAAADVVDAPWVSEHLSINRLRHADGSIHPTGFFLPPAQTPEAVEVAAANLRRLREITGRPVAFETGVNYLRPKPGEMSDGAFWRAVAEAADCYILCDLHNVWCNEVNGRDSLAQTIDELPLERICEVHLAGGRHHNGYLLDSHAGLVAPQLMAIAGRVIERLPALKAITFEMMPDTIPLCEIDEASYRAQFEHLQRLWARRGTAAGRAMCDVVTHVPGDTADAAAAPRHDAESWEAALAASFTHLPVDPHAAVDDPGIDLYRHLIWKMRSGTVINTHRLTYRLLALSEGLERANETLDDYQRGTPPALWIQDEAEGFSEYLRKAGADVPYLLDVMEYELASRQVALTGEPAEVRFGCDPAPLLGSLQRGERPTTPIPEPHVVLIEP